MVEFALVLPVLLLVVFGITQFGIAMHANEDETQVAAEVARYAAVNALPPGASSLAGWGDTQFTGALTSPSVCISFPDGTAINSPVQVTVSGTMAWGGTVGRSIGLSSPFQSTFSQTATERLEAVPTTYGAGCT